jgi:hypothetical protein
MRVILDTGALFQPEWLRLAVEEGLELVLPVVAFAERRRQLLRDGRDVGRFEGSLAEWGVRIEPLGVEQACRYTGVTDDDAWHELARDALVAAHVGDEDVLWTTNPKDFLRLGVPKERVVDVGAPRRKGGRPAA